MTRGGKRGPGPGKKIGRRLGSKAKPRLYLVGRGRRGVNEIRRLKVPGRGFERDAEGVTLGKARRYRVATLDSLEARAIYRYLQKALEGDYFLGTHRFIHWLASMLAKNDHVMFG